MTVTFVALLFVGLWMLVRGLKTVARARAAWEARSVPATAHVIACTRLRFRDPETGRVQFRISTQYLDTRGQAHTMELIAGHHVPTGEPIDIRFDPQQPATVHLPEHFPGAWLAFVLILFGGSLMLLSVAFTR